MERVNARHTETLKCCPHCERLYVVQHGGQKSGGSPAVHVQGSGGPATGHCSSRCQIEAQGGSMKNLRKWHERMGMNYDEIFEPGYLAPARIPQVLVQVAKIRNLQERVMETNGRR